MPLTKTILFPCQGVHFTEVLSCRPEITRMNEVPPQSWESWSPPAPDFLPQTCHSAWQREISRWGDYDICHLIYESDRALTDVTGNDRITGINWDFPGDLGYRVTLDLGLSFNLYQDSYVAGSKVTSFLWFCFFIGHMKRLHFLFYWTPTTKRYHWRKKRIKPISCSQSEST